MSRIRLDQATNYYATPGEVAEWLHECFQEHPVAHVFSKRPDRLTTDVDLQNQAAVARAVRQHTDLLLATDALRLDVGHVNQLAYANLDSLLVCLLRRTSAGLTCGTVAAGTRVPRHLRVWRKFAAALGARTAAGVWFGAPRRRAPLYDPNVRYTAGAAALWANGVPLLGGGQTRVVQLGPNTAG